MADIVVTPVDVVVTPDVMVTLQPKGAVVVPNGWSVVPSGGAMPQYEGVNAAVEARILQAESGMQANLDAKTAQLLSDIQDVETGLSTETATRVSEDEALATRIDTEVARIDDNVAAVQSGVVTNADNHTVLATQFDTYVAKTDSAIASANQEITVVAGKADANASAIGEMQAAMDGREASYAEAIDLTVTKLYEHFYYPVVPADLPTDYVTGDYLKFGYDYDASHPAGTVIHALSDCAGTFDMADWETPADQTVPRQYTASSTKIETLEANTEDIDVRLTSTEAVTAGYFHVWDGTEPLKIGMKRIDADRTTWTYLGGNLGENSDGWVKDNPQDDIAVTRKLNDVNTAIFKDHFDYADVTDIEKFYTLHRGDGDITFLPSTPESVGGKIMHIGDNTDDDDNWLTWKNPIPFDPNKLYKITVRVRRVSGTGTCYLGLAGIGSDGETYVNIYGNNSFGSQHSQVVVNYSPSDDQFHTLVGYLKGHSPSGSNGTYGSTTIDAPGTMHEDVRYFVPWMVVNYAYQSGEWEVDYFEVEDYTYTKELDDAYKEYNRVVALAIADGTLTSEEQALIAHAQAAVDEAKAKLNDALAIIQSPDNLLKWGNPTDAGTGWTPNRKSSSSVFKPYVRVQQERDQYETIGIDGTGGYHVIPCGAEKIYISGWVNTESSTQSAAIGMRMVTDGAAQNAWPVEIVSGPGKAWTYFEVSIETSSQYNGFIPFTQIPAFDTFGTVLWANLVYSRTPHRKRVDQVAGWAAGASSLITDPDGNITGWSYGDGSNVQSRFDVHGENFNVKFPSGAKFHVEESGLWFENQNGDTFLSLRETKSIYIDANTWFPVSSKDRNPVVMPRAVSIDPQQSGTLITFMRELTGSETTGDWAIVVSSMYYENYQKLYNTTYTISTSLKSTNSAENSIIVRREVTLPPGGRFFDFRNTIQVACTATIGGVEYSQPFTLKKNVYKSIQDSPTPSEDLIFENIYELRSSDLYDNNINVLSVNYRNVNYDSSYELKVFVDYELKFIATDRTRTVRDQYADNTALIHTDGNLKFYFKPYNEEQRIYEFSGVSGYNYEPIELLIMK